MNRWLLEARIVERAPVRYTPAGIPVVNCLLHHCSHTEEAGIARQVEMDVPAVAAGEIGGALERCVLDQIFRFTGFVAPRGRSSRGWIFHIIGLESI